MDELGCVLTGHSLQETASPAYEESLTATAVVLKLCACALS
jgi:hypothetical protein